MPMMAIVTRSSIKVKADLFVLSAYTALAPEQSGELK
jgi:hypothetical protein